MAATAAVVGAVAAVGGTTYGIVKSEQARKEQQRFASEQAEKQNAMFDEQRKKEEAARAEMKKAQEEAAANEAESEFQKTAAQRRDSGKARQRRMAAGFYGRSDTILTGPQGIVDEPDKKKTILGV